MLRYSATSILRKCNKSAFRRLPRRPSTPFSTLASAETVKIPRESNNNISVDIYYPAVGLPNPNGPYGVLIYLPRGPLFASTEHEASTLSNLRRSLHCPIVRVNYRTGSNYQYPTPVHDVSAGFDWIVENLLPKRAITRVGRPEHVGRIAVCGELIGGGLATALALTECRIGENGIVGAAVNNPLVDWVSINKSDSSMKKQSSQHYLSNGKTKDGHSVDDISVLRRSLFQKPEHYFDPFASPILFFRTASEDVPPDPGPLPANDMDVLSMIEREDFYREQLSLYQASADNDAEVKSSRRSTMEAKRKSSRRFPSPSFGLRLPSFHISAGVGSSLSGQAAELTHVLRQSFTRQSECNPSGPGSFGTKFWLEDEQLGDDQMRSREALKAEVEEKGQLIFHQGLGHWDDTDEGRERVLKVADWLKSKLI